MLNNVLQNISKFLINVFDFLTFRKNNVVLNNDIEIDQECDFFFSTFNSKEHVEIVDDKVILRYSI